MGVPRALVAERVHVAGRDYERDGGDTIRGRDAGPLRRVGQLPLGQALLTTAAPAYTPVVVYLHEWDGHLVPYVLQGGP